MSTTESNYDGSLISELGVKRYLSGVKSSQWSNVDFFLRGEGAQKSWTECNFGCHGPTYRSLTRPATFSEALRPIDDLSPAVAGAIDGIRHQTVGRAQRLAGGVERTAEGLMLNGEEDFRNVGDENLAAYQFATSTFEQLVSFEIDVLDNPLAQAVMVVVSEYIAVLPEWAVAEAYKEGALQLPEAVDTAWLMKAVSLGIIEGASREDLERAARLLNNPAQRLVGRQIGKRLANAIGAALASKICKKILLKSENRNALRRRLARLRSSARQLNGGLGGALLTLLNTQGVLDRAGESSRQLQQSCPRVWSTLRYRLNGANMVYFLVENMLQEYVDRLSLLERRPDEFARIMRALLRDRRTTDIFFPGSAL